MTSKGMWNSSTRSDFPMRGGISGMASAYRYGDSRRLASARESSDAVVWRTCQEGQLVLVTGNRNAERSGLAGDGHPARESAGQPTGLTLANPRRITRERDYADQVAERLLDYLMRSMRSAARDGSTFRNTRDWMPRPSSGSAVDPGVTCPRECAASRRERLRLGDRRR